MKQERIKVWCHLLKYIDFENKDGRDAGKDIALEVSRLKKLESTVLFLTYVMVVDRCQQLLILLIIH
jgi:hypothetical protein